MQALNRAKVYQLGYMAGFNNPLPLSEITDGEIVNILFRNGVDTLPSNFNMFRVGEDEGRRHALNKRDEQPA